MADIPRTIQSSKAYRGMPYRLFSAGHYDAATVELMTTVFDEICIELGLANREDRLRDLIAYEIMDCVGKGHRELNFIRGCVRTALRMPPHKA
jgi:hypothetical protein